ncbi:unnamed protein product [Rodentolepis nana]|uniref:Ashwin n=1 Tax=Rodentolepis nana TaxID=102285 RepID=A0A0R3T983_RODNA|nr:unnamed protein product [Rodentolepis nana]
MPSLRNRSKSPKSACKIKAINENLPMVRLERLPPETVDQFKIPETPIDSENIEPKVRSLRSRNTFHSTVNDTPRTPEKSADLDKPSCRVRGPLRVKNTMVSPRTPVKSADAPSVPKSTKRITLRSRNTVMTVPSASIQERARTPRTCKEVAMAKIIQCYAELSLSPKSKRVTQTPSRTPLTRRHTEKGECLKKFFNLLYSYSSRPAKKTNIVLHLLIDGFMTDLGNKTDCLYSNDSIN